MNKKLLKYSVFCVVCYVVIVFTFLFSPYEFINRSLALTIFNIAYWFAFANLFLIWLSFYSNSKLSIVVKLLLSLASLIFIFPLTAIFFIASEGLYNNFSREEIIFINKQINSQKVVERFDISGFIDAKEVSTGYYLVTNINSLILKVEKIDTSNLNKDNWIRRQ